MAYATFGNQRDSATAADDTGEAAQAELNDERRRSSHVNATATAKSG
jgi:hypothetical protein